MTGKREFPHCEPIFLQAPLSKQDRQKREAQMFLSPVRRSLIIVFVLLLRSAPVRPVTPDQKLLRLVPPDTQVLAGINPAPPGNRHNRFVLITRENLKDMDDFKSLSGGDPTAQSSNS